MPRLATISLSALCLLLTVQGCGDSKRRGGGASTTAGVTSSTQTGPVGPLTQKALDFEDTTQAQHIHHGQIQAVKVDAAGQVAPQPSGDRCIWTGFYAGTEAMRYRVTRDPQALANMEEALWALHGMHVVTGDPGIIARGFGDLATEPTGLPGQGSMSNMAFQPSKPSRDQYTGWFYGVGISWNEIQDPALRQALQDDVRAVCDRLMVQDLRLEGTWKGKQQRFFDLNPDGFFEDDLDAAAWAKVDDFPLNLVTQNVPYDPQLAQTIMSTPIPPIRAGEAVRAALIFTVAEHVTGDGRYRSYRQDFMYGRKNFAQVIDDNYTLVDDALHGKNMPAVRVAVEGIAQYVTTVLQIYIQNTNQSALLSFIAPIAAQGIASFISDIALKFLDYVQNPNNQTQLGNLVRGVQTLVALLNLLGVQGLAQQITGALNQYGSLLNSAGLHDFAQATRSYASVHLSLVPLSLLVQLETDPNLIGVYQRAIDDAWSYTSGEHNAMINLIHHGYGSTPGPNDIPDTISPLTLYPSELGRQVFDNSNWPGLVRSPFPDRLGKSGNLASNPLFFPTDKRAVGHWPWGGHPRKIVGGANIPEWKDEPLGYVMPYWMARDLNVITQAD